MDKQKIAQEAKGKEVLSRNLDVLHKLSSFKEYDYNVSAQEK